MPLTVEEAKRAIIILKGIQDKQLKESTKEYLKPIEHKVWHDAVQEQMIAMTLELDKFFKKQADILYQLIHEKEQLFVPKMGNEESIAITKALQAIDLITKDDKPKKYKVWEYLDSLYNRVVVDDIKDTIVEYARKFKKELEKVYHKVTKKTYEKVSQSINTDETPFEFNKSNKWVKEHIQEKAVKWSKQVAQTTEERVKRKLVKEYEKGSSVYDTAKSLKEDEAFSFSRAEKVARTEIFSSGNHVDYLSFNQNEDVVGYKWCSMEDKRVRPTHARANGQFRKKGEPFSVGGSKLLYPGDNSLGAVAKEVICCRCYLEPVFTDEIDTIVVDNNFKISYTENKDVDIIDELQAINNQLILIPEEHKALLKEYIKEIKVGEQLGAFYKRDERAIYIDYGYNEEEGALIHEFGHAIETKLDLFHQQDFLEVLGDGLPPIDPLSGVVLSDEFEMPIDVLAGEHPKFISSYQKMVYEEDIDKEDRIDSSTWTVKITCLLEYFSEGYREYIQNPKNLKQRDKLLFEYIEREIK